MASDLYKINNDNCLLVSFVNENFSMRTGFINWLKVDKVDKDAIDRLIESKTDVLINWPDIDTCPASKSFINKLKSSTFKSECVTILGQGSKISLYYKSII